ncbi:murein hydrolase activator EnvC family protein [Patescibacteria group bacterium]
MKIKTSKKLLLVFAVFLMAGLLFSTVFVLAEESSEAEEDSNNNKQKLEGVIDDKETDIDEIQEEIRRYTADVARLESDVQNLENKIKVSVNEIELTNLAVKKTSTEMKQTDAEIKITREHVEEKENDLQYNRQVLSSLMRDIRHHDDMSDLALVLKSTSFSDVLAIERQTQNYQGKTKELYDNVKVVRDELIAKKQELETKRKEQEDLKSQLEAQQSELERQKQESEQLLVDTERNEEKYLEMIGAAADEQRKLAQEIQELEKQMIAQNQVAGKSSGPPVTGSGVLMMPVENGSSFISQGYGLTSYAQTGVYGYENGSPRIHAGVDFAVPCGSSLLNSADGVVDATFDLQYGFGKGVVVWHENLNLYTLHGHMSRIAVSPGQIIERGDIVGFVGSTGFSTGCHEHHAVYVEMAYAETSYGRSPWYAPDKTLNPMGLYGAEEETDDAESEDEEITEEEAAAE